MAGQKFSTFFPTNWWNSYFYWHIWIQHEKCIQMSTNKPSIGPMKMKMNSESRAYVLLDFPYSKAVQKHMQWHYWRYLVWRIREYSEKGKGLFFNQMEFTLNYVVILIYGWGICLLWCISQTLLFVIFSSLILCVKSIFSLCDINLSLVVLCSELDHL